MENLKTKKNNKIEWSKEQLKAIKSRNVNILVSAAAGSGKTAILSQRIIDLIVENKENINSMLILTFTNAAANEMKSRISKKLYELYTENTNNTHIKNQILLINEAHIETMHSFCMYLIKDNFELIDIEPNFSIGNESILKILKDDSLNTIFQEKYEKEDKEFITLLDLYAKEKNDTNLKDLILNIYSFIQSEVEPLQWLKEASEKYSNNEPFFEKYIDFLKNIIFEKLNFIEENIEYGIKLASKHNVAEYLENLNSDFETLLELKNALTKSYDNFIDLLQDLKITRLKTIKNKDEEKKEIYKTIKDLRTINIKKYGFEKLKDFSSSTEIFKKHIKESSKTVNSIFNLVKEFSIEYSNRKKEEDICDFNDLEHFAIDILKNKKVQTSVRKKFKFIFYDEFQDSNNIHNEILNMIKSKNNLFLVGDTKQSIYRFRLANPKIFIDKYNFFQTHTKDNLKIDLSKNFRSHKDILDFCNKIFEKIMIKSVSGIDYNENNRLICGLDNNDSNEYNTEHRIEINLIDKNDDLKIKENDELIAEFTALKIIDLVENHNVKYKDIAILKRALKGSVPIYINVFRKYKIPIFIDYSESIFNTYEVSLFINLLKIIDNSYQDEPLLILLMSNIFNFSLEDIAKIKALNKKETFFYKLFFKYGKSKKDNLSRKINAFINKINNYSTMKNHMILKDFISYLLIDTNYKTIIQTLPSPQERLENVEFIEEIATEFMEKDNNSLFSFLNYIDLILKNKTDDIMPTSISEERNVVKLMSIHKSKGQEFNVVFLDNINKKFNFKENNQDIVLDDTLGIGVDYIDKENNFYTNTLIKKDIILKNTKETVAEEIRMLYVALTRAKKLLILNGYEKKPIKKISDLLENNSLKKPLSDMDNFKDFIFFALKDELLDFLDSNSLINEKENSNIIFKSDLFKINSINLNTLMDSESSLKITRKDFENKLKNVTITKEERENLKKNINLKYKYQEDVTKPVKSSVTEIIRNKKEIIIDDLINYKDFTNKTKFKPEEIGTLNHIYLSTIDFKKDYTIKDLEIKLDKMYKDYFFKKEELQTIKIKEIYNFLISPLGKRIQKSKRIFQEESFLTKINGTLISGIVDLFFEEDDNFVLLDYKTDSVSLDNYEKVANLYKKQLSIYKNAIEESFNKKVIESYIYFLNINKAVLID